MLPTLIKIQTRCFGRRTCSSNSNFFKQWSPAMAYWLGFLFADGCVFTYKGAPRGVSVHLKCTDVKQVINFANCLESTYKIGFCENKNSKFCGVKHHICDKEIANDLVKLGCVPRKTFILVWPEQLPTNLENHFVRGYFDGDGCLTFSRTSVCIYICGTYAFLQKLQTTINSHVKQRAKGCLSKNKSIWRLMYGGTFSATNVMKWIYENNYDSNLYLHRKLILFQELEQIVQLPPKQRLQKYEQFRSTEEWEKCFKCNSIDCPQEKKQK